MKLWIQQRLASDKVPASTGLKSRRSTVPAPGAGAGHSISSRLWVHSHQKEAT